MPDGLLVALELISIHAPREGGDYSHLCKQTKALKFQSTPPARGATAKLHKDKGKICVSCTALR